MVRGALGKIYGDGDEIIRQGNSGDSMYVVQGGRVEVLQHSKKGREQHLAFLDAGDFFGEMALITKNKRSASALSKEECVLIKIEKTKMYFIRIFLK